ncbi:MAG: sugar porter family MFS transporter [Verrucomicrobiota bacterium]
MSTATQSSVPTAQSLGASAKGSTGYVVLICLVATLGGLLFGYDTAVISGAIGFLKEKFAMDPRMEGWSAGCILIGCMIGVSIAGAFGDRLGRKKLLVFSGVLFGASAVGTALPKELWMFIVFRILCGIGVGAASIASPMYIAEVAPARLRGRMVSLNQMAIVTGIFVVYFINWYIAGKGDHAWNVNTGWRWMFAMGALPSLVFLGLLLLVPESPRWLMEQNREAEALKVLTRVNGQAAAEVELQAIKASLSHEGASLRQLLQPGMRLVLVIGIVLAVLQQITGINAFIYFGPKIFESVGSSTNVALLQHISVGAVNFLFTIVAIWTVDKWGRRPLMLWGTLGMGICLVSMAAALYYKFAPFWMLVFILGYMACFSMSLGPVTWVIIAEIFPTRIRGRAMALATLCLWFADYVVTQSFPMLMDRFKDLPSVPFVLYGLMCVLEILFVWRFVPETKGQSLEQIETMFEKSGH